MVVVPNAHDRGSEMEVLLYAIGALAILWIVVLVGSPFFGPGNH